MSRRTFLIASAPLVTALAPGALLADPVWARSRRRTYYVLDAEYGTGPKCHGKEDKKRRSCHGCKACHSHAKYKMFATRRAADEHRAHRGCKCRVVKGGTLRADVWAELFGGRKGPRRPVADRRSKRVKRILRRAQLRDRAAARP